MTEERPVLREVAWQEIFPGILLLSAWKVAIGLRLIAFGACGTLITWLGWVLIDRVFDVNEQQSLAFTWFSPVAARLPEGGATNWWLTSPIFEAWADLSRAFVQAFSPEISASRFLYLAVCGLWALVVWAFFGGAITRMAAVQLARDERITWGQAFSYAWSKWPAYIASPLFPMFGVLLATIPLALIGLIARGGGFGLTVAGILWPVVLFAGFVMAVLLVGLFFNWPLMWPTISSEGTDSFDALSRSYAYSFQRPLRYAAYLFLVAVIGVLGWLLVTIFASAVQNLAMWAVSWGSGSEIDLAMKHRKSLDGMQGFGVNLIYWWNRAVGLIVVGFVFSYFFVSATAIYLMLRFHVDATETDEVFLTDENEPRHLPPLTTDAAGVAKVADAGSSSPTSSPEG